MDYRMRLIGLVRVEKLVFSRVGTEKPTQKKNTVKNPTLCGFFGFFFFFTLKTFYGLQNA